MAARTEQIDQYQKMIVDQSSLCVGIDEIAVSKNQRQLSDDVVIVNPAVLELHRETGNLFVKRNRHTTPLSVFIVGTLCAAPGGIFWPCGLSVFSTERNGPS